MKEKKPLFKNEKPHIFLIVFENGLKAVFKMKKKINLISSLRAYHLSQFLNLRVVPPTVIRAIEGKRGILQYFIEGQRLIDIDLETLTEIQKIKVYLFYFLIGYNDPHDENIIMGRNCGHLAVVDNSANMWFPTISQFKDFPFITDFSSKLRIFLRNGEQFPLFDVARIQSFKFTKKVAPNHLFKIIGKPVLIYNRIYSYGSKNTTSQNTIYLLEWLNQDWMKFNEPEFKLVYIDFASDFIPKKDFKRLKQLNSLEQLNSGFLAFIESYFSEKEINEQLFRIKVFNYFTLYNGQTLLEVFDE